MTAQRTTRGVVFIHSATPALEPHVEWALSGVLGYRVHIEWTAQGADPAYHRGEMSWQGPVGLGAVLASALNGWEHLRYEITEEGTATSEGGRWSHTPSLGIFYAQTDLVGNVVVPEDRLRAALEYADTDPAEMRRLIDLALGQAWDEELEPFRYAGAGAPVRWLHHVG